MSGTLKCSTLKISSKRDNCICEENLCRKFVARSSSLWNLCEPLVRFVQMDVKKWSYCVLHRHNEAVYQGATPVECLHGLSLLYERTKKNGMKKKYEDSLSERRFFVFIFRSQFSLFLCSFILASCLLIGQFGWPIRRELASMNERRNNEDINIGGFFDRC